MIGHKTPEDIWKDWNVKKDTDNLVKLIDVFEPDVKYVVSKFKEADVPGFAIEADAKKNLVKSFHTYDPTKNIKLRTHAINSMQKVNRFIYDNQNVGKIPEHRILGITKFKDAQMTFKINNGRSPSSHELADTLKWDIAEVYRMNKELNKGVIGERADITKNSYNFVDDALSSYIYNSISPHLKLLFEYTVGYNGQPELEASEIKRKMNLTDTDYRKLRDELKKELIKYNAYDLAN